MAQAARLDATDQVRAFRQDRLCGRRRAETGTGQRDELQVFARIARLLLRAAHLNFHLAGDDVADMSGSAGTSWLDVGNRSWSERLLAAGHMRRDRTPRLVEGAEAAAYRRPELVRKRRLSGPVTVAGGAGGNASAACGTEALDERQGFVSPGPLGRSSGGARRMPSCPRDRACIRSAMPSRAAGIKGRWCCRSMSTTRPASR
ncbi:MAG: hypothetical protein KJN93_06335 [Alphaproteobacteria bacterium]|nr:hypothetical protein [Alphaproteobacteria bacterium]